MILNQHQLARIEARVHAARGVRHDHNARTQANHQAQTKDDIVRRVALIEMHAALHRHAVHALGLTEDKLARMTLHTALWHRRDLAERNRNLLIERVREITEARAKHQRDLGDVRNACSLCLLFHLLVNCENGGIETFRL